MLFNYFWFTYNIVKLQTCSSWHSWAIAIIRFSLLNKSVVTWMLLHLQYFVSIYFLPTFYSNMILYFGVPFAGYSFCVLFFLHFSSKTQDTQSADTEPIHGYWLLVLFLSPDFLELWRSVMSTYLITKVKQQWASLVSTWMGDPLSALLESRKPPSSLLLALFDSLITTNLDRSILRSK